MSIIRVGLAETRNFAEGYDLIFGKKDAPEQPGAPAEDQKANEKQGKTKTAKTAKKKDKPAR